MKTLFKIMALFMLFFSFAACNDDDEVAEATLEVSAANINGTWQLTEWNGQPLAEGTYCYITFSRREKSFKMYDNLQSMYTHLSTGVFDIEKDRKLGYIISGDYDFGNGKWENEYIVTNLTPNGQMTWTNKDNMEDVQLFQRCDKVPQEIVDQARQELK